MPQTPGAKSLTATMQQLQSNIPHSAAVLSKQLMLKSVAHPSYPLIKNGLLEGAITALGLSYGFHFHYMPACILAGISTTAFIWRLSRKPPSYSHTTTSTSTEDLSSITTPASKMRFLNHIQPKYRKAEQLILERRVPLSWFIGALGVISIAFFLTIMFSVKPDPSVAEFNYNLKELHRKEMQERQENPKAPAENSIPAGQ